MSFPQNKDNSGTGCPHTLNVKIYDSIKLVSAKKIETESKKKQVEEKINELMTSIFKILNQEKINDVSFDSIYYPCYKISIEKGGNLLDESFNTNIENYITSKFLECLEFLNIDQGVFFGKIVELYDKFIKKVDVIQKTLLYHEKNYLLKNNLPNIKTNCKNKFQKIVFNEKIKNIVINFIINKIESDRENIFTDKILIKDIINILNDISEEAYFQILQNDILANTKLYYENDYLKNIQNKNPIEYSIYAKHRILSEEQRINDFNLFKSRSKIMQLLCEQLVLNFLMDENQIIPLIIKLIKLNDAYHLNILKDISIYNLQDKFIEVFGKSLEVQGKELIKEKCSYWNSVNNINIGSNNEENINLINSLIEFFDRIDSLKKDLGLLHSKHYINIITQRLCNVVNNKDYSMLIAKILPKQIDHNFKLFIKAKPNNNELMVYIDKIILLTRLILDKDIFELNHRRLLSFRLLNGVFYDEIETKLLGKLKLENGAVFTQRCEVMINDLKTSNHMMEQYSTSDYFHKKYLEGDGDNINPITNNLEFNIKVLTQGNRIISSEENIPTTDLLKYAERPEFKFMKILTSFDLYYKCHFHNKVLNHNLFLGTCEVYSKIKGRNYYISMTPFQSLFCLLFNRNNKVPFSELNEIFKIKDVRAIVNNIIPLIKTGLITVNNENELNEMLKIKISPNQTQAQTQSQTNSDNNNICNNNLISSSKNTKLAFFFNSNFFNKQQRLKISVSRYINEKNSVTEEKQSESVYLERKYLIESNIIRIMKSRQNITHQDLINEVLLTINNIFVPEIIVIKQRIESLLERGYISHCLDNYTTYIYSS